MGFVKGKSVFLRVRLPLSSVGGAPALMLHGVPCCTLPPCTVVCKVVVRSGRSKMYCTYCLYRRLTRENMAQNMHPDYLILALQGVALLQFVPPTVLNTLLAQLLKVRGGLVACLSVACSLVLLLQ